MIGKNQKYLGTLEYLDERGHMLVSELFVRDDCVAVSGASVTPEYGSWQFSVELPLRQGVYQAISLYAHRDGTVSDAFELRIRLSELPDGSLKADGIWIERFSSRFTGTLSAA